MRVWTGSKKKSEQQLAKTQAFPGLLKKMPILFLAIKPQLLLFKIDSSEYNILLIRPYLTLDHDILLQDWVECSCYYRFEFDEFSSVVPFSC